MELVKFHHFKIEGAKPGDGDWGKRQNIDFFRLRLILISLNIRVVIEYDSEAQAYAAYCPELPGCTNAGMTEEEALENIREAIDLYFAPDDLPIENRRVYQISV